MSTATAPAPARTPTVSWAPFRNALEKLRTELLRDRELAWAVVGRFPDPAMVARTRRMDITLDDIEAALARLEAGTYGACIHCGRTIMLKRLTALPYVSGCNRCMRALQELPIG
jgi:hypothetical protein